jgi:hypothetical protein
MYTNFYTKELYSDDMAVLNIILAGNRFKKRIEININDRISIINYYNNLKPKRNLPEFLNWDFLFLKISP